MSPWCRIADHVGRNVGRVEFAHGLSCVGSSTGIEFFRIVLGIDSDPFEKGNRFEKSTWVRNGDCGFTPRPLGRVMVSRAASFLTRKPTAGAAKVRMPSYHHWCSRSSISGILISELGKQAYSKRNFSSSKTLQSPAPSPSTQQDHATGR